MKYYKIKCEKGATAVVFHDYVTSHYIVQSRSESFRKSFESSVKSTGKVLFKRSNNSLKIFKSGPNHIHWMDNILSKACGNYWTIEDSGDVGLAYADDISTPYLS